MAAFNYSLIASTDHHQYSPNIPLWTIAKTEKTKGPEPIEIAGLPNPKLDDGNDTQEWRDYREYLEQILHMTDATW